MRFYGILLFLLLLSLISYLKRWPYNWRDGGLLRGRQRDHLHQRAIEHEAHGDAILMEVADVIIQLRTNAERLELALKSLQEEE